MTELSNEQIVEILFHLVEDTRTKEQMEAVQQEKIVLCTSQNAFFKILYYLQDKLELPDEITQDARYMKYKDIFKISLKKLIKTEINNLIQTSDVESVIHELRAIFMNSESQFDEIADIFVRITSQNPVYIETLLQEIESIEGFESNLLLQCKYATIFCKISFSTSDNEQYQKLCEIFQSFTETPEKLFDKIEYENKYEDYYILIVVNSVLNNIYIGANTDREIRLQQMINYDYFLNFFEYSKLPIARITEYENCLNCILKLLYTILRVIEDEEFSQKLANSLFGPLVELIQYNLNNNYKLFEDNIGISALLLNTIFEKLQNLENIEPVINTLIMCCYPFEFDDDLVENEGFFEKYFDVHYFSANLMETDQLFTPASIIINCLLSENTDIYSATWNILTSETWLFSPATITIVTMLVHSCIAEAFVPSKPNVLPEILSNAVKSYIEAYLGESKPENISDEMYYLYRCLICTILPYFGTNDFPEIFGDEGSVVQISAISLFFRHVRVSLLSGDKTYLTQEIAQQLIDYINGCYFRESNKTLLSLISIYQSIGKDIILELFRNEFKDIKSIIENNIPENEDEDIDNVDKIVMDVTQIIEYVASYRDFDQKFCSIYLSILKSMSQKNITAESFFSLPIYYAHPNPMVFFIVMISIYANELFSCFIYDSMMKFNVEFAENPKMITDNQAGLFIQKVIPYIITHEIGSIDLEASCLFFALSILYFDFNEAFMENIYNFADEICNLDGIEFLSGLELISALIIKLDFIPSEEIINHWLEFCQSEWIIPDYPRALLGTALRKLSTLIDFENENIAFVSNFLLSGQLPEGELDPENFFYQELRSLYPSITTIPLFNADEFVSVQNVQDQND
ncbi:hypothetical protein TVAG_314890 [Trichomonas vaginalis G3]|uniref:Uncharacterized protein n=1 Tax=Trichomonas vaginalis (strain ATCC PRA-98 / G3) TaxID=412133 RepID=A2ETS8_TRIV3|nr:hypothetical protein TVAGG3_0045900 [Trichomonas vaginalis G3]EAY03959.1 hypothetical protein TVAG_314890 [Trichomonas vaginalis G3]KAI5541022.1 hypothetical protein TVAGG3_0045900 [Trichomonas vaginalis G3]|eukprot:XP_001316182.1 hypothetical protein [Trichomonas vaginalis G3]